MYNVLMPVILNQPVPDFSLPDLDGRMHRLSAYRGRIVIVNFWSAECPWSARADKYLTATLSQLRDQVAMLTIASNVNESADLITATAQQQNLNPVLRDAGCGVADLFGAQTTPHAFVIDADGVLRYRGAVDDVTFRRRAPSRFYVEAAVEALLENRLPEVQEAPPYGCAIVREI
jgi:peroxiredoxin